jgi:hypothetical protein
MTEMIRKTLSDAGEPADGRRIPRTWKDIRRYNSSGHAYGVQFKAAEEDEKALPNTYIISGEVKNIFDLDENDKPIDGAEGAQASNALYGTGLLTYIKTQLGEILAFDPETMILVADDEHHEPHPENFVS